MMCHLLILFRWAVGMTILVNLAACRPVSRVIINTKEGKIHNVKVAIADTPVERELGLQYQRDLADDEGMLFLFPTEEVQTFWMKNTPIPLDIIFISSNRNIVGVIQQAAPFATEYLSVPVPSQFVLEVKGGFAGKKGIGIGDTVLFEGINKDLGR